MLEQNLKLYQGLYDSSSSCLLCHTSSANLTLSESASWYSSLSLAAFLSATDIFFSISSLLFSWLSKNCRFSRMVSSRLFTSSRSLANSYKIAATVKFLLHSFF